MKTLECSSKGDKRFSAFYAMVPCKEGGLIMKSKKRIIAEAIHYNIFRLLRPTLGIDRAYAIASGYCPIFEDAYRNI